jgi:hypothetical protein
MSSVGDLAGATRHLAPDKQAKTGIMTYFILVWIGLVELAASRRLVGDNRVLLPDISYRLSLGPVAHPDCFGT